MRDEAPAATPRRSGPKVGKSVWGTLYVHRSALGETQAKDREAVARVTANANDDWNVVRIRGAAVALLSHLDLDVDAFPALAYAQYIDERGATGTGYRSRANLPILHRKELLLGRSDPRRVKWAALTTRLVELGMFAEPHLIDTRQGWERRLARHRVVIETSESQAIDGDAAHDPPDA